MRLKTLFEVCAMREKLREAHFTDGFEPVVG